MSPGMPASRPGLPLPPAPPASRTAQSPPKAHGLSASARGFPGVAVHSLALTEELLGCLGQVSRRSAAQPARVEIPYADAIQAVGIFEASQLGRHFGRRVVVRHVPAADVGQLLLLRQGETGLQERPVGLDPLGGARAVPGVAAVGETPDVVHSGGPPDDLHVGAALPGPRQADLVGPDQHARGVPQPVEA